MLSKPIAILFLLCFGLAAHDLYLRPASFRPQPGSILRVEYHNGDTFPASEVPARIERLRDMKLIASNASTPFTNMRIEGTSTVGDVEVPSTHGNFLLVSRTIPNFIELDPAKFEDYLKHESLDHVVEWRKKNNESAKPGRETYSKYVKSLLLVGKASAHFGAIAGLTLEFVPLANPYEIAAGGALPIRVLFRGKPAAGLAIEASNALSGEVTKKIAGRTDDKGEIRVPLVRAGLWKLHTVLMERRTETKQSDWDSFWGSLTFEVAEPKR